MMKTIIALLALLVYVAGSNIQADHIFEKTVERFKAKIAGTNTIHQYELLHDSAVHQESFIALLDRELKTTFRKQHPGYMRCWLGTEFYNLAVHELVFSKTISPLPSRTIRPITKAPLEFSFLQIKNRLIVFAYSPFKMNDTLKSAIADFESIYRELVNDQK